jgi:hypothetical protein
MATILHRPGGRAKDDVIAGVDHTHRFLAMGGSVARGPDKEVVAR